MHCCFVIYQELNHHVYGKCNTMLVAFIYRRVGVFPSWYWNSSRNCQSFVSTNVYDSVCSSQSVMCVWLCTKWLNWGNLHKRMLVPNDSTEEIYTKGFLVIILLFFAWCITLWNKSASCPYFACHFVHCADILGLLFTIGQFVGL